MQQKIIQTFFVRAGSTIINFLMAWFIARQGGSALKGEVTILVTSVTFIVFAANLIGGPSLIYLKPRFTANRFIAPSVFWALGVTFISYLILFATDIIPPLYHLPIALLGLITSLNIILQNVLMAEKMINRSNLIGLLTLIAQVTILVLTYQVFSKLTVKYYVVATLLANSLAIITAMFLLRSTQKQYNESLLPSWIELKEMLRHGASYKLAELLQLVQLRYCFFHLGLQQGMQYLGVFSIGISILESIWLIPRSIATVHHVETSNTQAIQKEIGRTVVLIKISVLTTAFFCAIYMFVPEHWIGLVFGNEFIKLKHASRFLVPGIPVYSIVLVLCGYYYGTGNYKPLLTANIIGSILVITFSWFLLRPYVISGAGLAMSLSFMGAALYLSAYFIYQNKIPFHQLLLTKRDFNTLRKLLTVD